MMDGMDLPLREEAHKGHEEGLACEARTGGPNGSKQGLVGVGAALHPVAVLIVVKPYIAWEWV